MPITHILAAALLWGRRLAFAPLAFALVLLVPAVPAHAVDPTPGNLIRAGLLSMPEPCRISREEFGVGPLDNVWVDRIAEDVWVVIAQCEHHAYQSTDVVMRVEQRGGTVTSAVLAFPVWRESEGTPWPYIASQPWLTGLPGDVTDGLLALYYRGRGIGDCGEMVTYDLTDPVVRIAEYRAKVECDGEWVEPETWPLVPQEVLDAHAPAFSDRRAGELLSAVVLAWPGADWMAHAIARGDLTGDGREEQWIGGYSQDWDTGATTYHLVMQEGGRLRSWDFPVAADIQIALCFPAASLAFEAPDLLVVSDGGCDRLRISWDNGGDTIAVDRN